MNRSFYKILFAIVLIILLAELCLFLRGCNVDKTTPPPAPPAKPVVIITPDAMVGWRKIEPPTYFNPASDFAADKNPAGVWSYGKMAADGVFQPYDTQHQDQGVQGWKMGPIPDSAGSLLFNPTDKTVRIAGTIDLPSKGLSMHPGQNHIRCVLRWTAPKDGTATGSGAILGYSNVGGTPQTVMTIAAGSETLATSRLNHEGKPNRDNFQFQRQVKTGDTIDFRLDYPGGFFCLTTGLDVTITLQATPPKP
jgi:hypothetical protein